MSDKTNTARPVVLNLNDPHPMMISSGKFWRCDHGSTGMGPNGEWVGCAECDAATVLSQPAQVGEWVKEAERLTRVLRIAVTKQAVFPSGPAVAAVERADATLLAHLRTRPAEDAALLKDALRYRWLKADVYEHADAELPHVVVHCQNSWGNWQNRLLEGEAMDAGIDAAIERLGAIGAGEEEK